MSEPTTATEAMAENAHERKIAECREAYPILKFFEYKHLPERLRPTSELFCMLAFNVAANSPKNAETSAALRKLLEAKDCAVRAAL